MSKEAAVRAMREARYAEQQARAGSRPAAARPPVAPPTVTAKTPARGASARSATSEAAGASDPALCGHRSMNGRTCTREQGHAAKNHRYS